MSIDDPLIGLIYLLRIMALCAAVWLAIFFRTANGEAMLALARFFVALTIGLVVAIAVPVVGLSWQVSTIIGLVSLDVALIYLIAELTRRR